MIDKQLFVSIISEQIVNYNSKLSCAFTHEDISDEFIDLFTSIYNEVQQFVEINIPDMVAECISTFVEYCRDYQHELGITSNEVTKLHLPKFEDDIYDKILNIVHKRMLAENQV